VFDAIYKGFGVGIGYSRDFNLIQGGYFKCSVLFVSVIMKASPFKLTL